MVFSFLHIHRIGSLVCVLVRSKTLHGGSEAKSSKGCRSASDDSLVPVPQCTGQRQRPIGLDPVCQLFARDDGI